MGDYKSIFTEPVGAEFIRLWNECMEREYRRAHLKASEDCPEGTKLIQQGKDCRCIDISPKERGSDSL